MTAALEELVWTVKEAADRLKISERTLWGLTRDGKIPAVRICGRKFYREAELRAYVESLTPVARRHSRMGPAPLSTRIDAAPSSSPGLVPQRSPAAKPG